MIQKRKFELRQMNTVRFICMAVLAFVMTACSKEDNPINQQEPQGDMVSFRATIAASGERATTRMSYTEEEDVINVSWNVGDMIALVHDGYKDVVSVTTVNPDGSAEIKGEIHDPLSKITVRPSNEKPGETILVYPAAYVDDIFGPFPIPPSDYVATGHFSYYLCHQEGTLDFIQDKLCLHEGTGMIVVNGNEATLKDDVELECPITIWKFTMTDHHGKDFKPQTLTVTVGDNEPVSASGFDSNVCYIAVKPGSTDATDVTIKASNGAFFYSSTMTDVILEANEFLDNTLEFTNPTIDLSQIKENTIVEDGYTLTGKITNTAQHHYKVRIGDNATVTLDNVSIGGYTIDADYAGITCISNATIILKEGTTNNVSGCYSRRPGIFVGENYTLTIQGTGTLNATGCYRGAGIGGGMIDSPYARQAHQGCGDIVIKGGIINATGGEYAAGIGGGDLKRCGTITIEGGTVNAKGGSLAAGIGGCYKAYCDAITITNGVTKVTAIKGDDAPRSIGGGAENTIPGTECEKVTIGGTEYWGMVSSDPETYDYKNGGEAYLSQSPLVYQP